MPPSVSSLGDLRLRVRQYWNQHIHDLEISQHAPGSPGFFRDLDEYHFEKLHHLLALVPYDRMAGKRVLEVGCGAGVDLVRFARGGAAVTGVDVAESSIRLARQYLGQAGLRGGLLVGDGERLPFAADTFDLVFAHGVVQYTADDGALVEECRRVVRPRGQVIFQVYNRISWLNALSKVMRVALEHEDAPVLRKYSPAEFRRLLGAFPAVRLVYERFPVKSRLHGGWKGTLYNGIFVGGFNALPRVLVQRYGWHLLAVCQK